MEPNWALVERVRDGGLWVVLAFVVGYVVGAVVQYVVMERRARSAR